jgi:hypothetical protein
MGRGFKRWGMQDRSSKLTSTGHVPTETVLEAQAKNHVYTIVHKAWDQALISRQPEFSQMLPDDDSRAADAWETVVAPIQ